MRRLFPFANAGLSIFLAASSSAYGTQGGDVSVSLVSDKPSFTLKEPATARLVIRNNSNAPVSFDLGLNNEANLRWSATLAGDSKTVQPAPQITGFGTVGRHRLRPSEEFSQRLILDQWIKFEQPGDYQVELVLTSPPKFDGGGLVAEAGAQTTIRVLPFDENSLRRRCQALSRQALSQNSARARHAARVLSFVSDPLVVPYLDKVLASSYFGREIAVQGLGKFATTEAVDSLIAVLGGGDPDIAALARYQLNQLAGSAEDESLRKRIAKVLSKRP